MQKHIYGILLFICFQTFLNAQEQGAFGGYFISYMEESDAKSKNMDVMRGYIFVPHRKMVKPLKLKLTEINALEQNRDSLFFISAGGTFQTLASCFNVNLDPIAYDNLLFPDPENYTYSDKKKIYKSTFVEIQFLKKTLSEKELIHLIALEKYHFKNKNAVPVFFIRGIEKR